MRYSFLIIFFLLNTVNTKPLYNEKQLQTLLYNHSRITKSFPRILGIHFYNNKEGRVLQLEIETEFIKKEIIVLTMNSLAKIGQFSKTPLYNFVLINHYKGSDIPISYESDVECTIKYFIRREITQGNWMKNCLSNSVTQKKIQNWSEINFRE